MSEPGGGRTAAPVLDDEPDVDAEIDRYGVLSLPAG